jgi:hypothetical protein
LKSRWQDEQLSWMRSNAAAAAGQLAGGVISAASTAARSALVVLAERRLDVVGDRAQRLQARQQVGGGAAVLLDRAVERAHLRAEQRHDPVRVGIRLGKALDRHGSQGRTDQQAQHEQHEVAHRDLQTKKIAATLARRLFAVGTAQASELLPRVRQERRGRRIGLRTVRSARWSGARANRNAGSR